MNFRPNPLLYAANEDFFSAFRIALPLRFEVDHAVLSQAVKKAMKRYPYFCVRPQRQGNEIILTSNTQELPVFPDARSVTLGTEQSNYHLLTFGCEKNTIFIDASHYIADGMGIDPLMKTVLYLYVSALYGEDGLAKERIRMPDDHVSEEEYEYPFPSETIGLENALLLPKASGDVYTVDPAAFDDGGLYAYHLHIPQKPMMAKANTSDGSPVSFLSVMLYRAMCALDGKIERPVVVHVQHQYRSALNVWKSHHSLVNYLPIVFSPRISTWDVERQNTTVRGQTIIGTEKDTDLAAINHFLSSMAPVDASLEEKKRAAVAYVDESICGKTFGISYVGKMDWCGLDKYVEDIHAYIGEKHTKNMILIEVMTIGEDFSVNFMQSGKGEKYLQAFIDQLKESDVPVSLIGEERYTLCNTRIPE